LPQKRKWLLYLLFLGLPTLAIGVSALVLLRLQQERLTNRFLADAEFKAEALGQQIARTIEDTQAGLMAELGLVLEASQPTGATTSESPEGPAPGPSVPGQDRDSVVERPIEALIRLREAEPAIRNVFVWHPSTGLKTGPPNSSLSMEEVRFASRYQSLFSVEGQWSREPVPESATTGQSLSKRKRIAPGRNSGWKVWYWEDRFSWLGWLETRPGGEVIGAELETVYLLSLAIANLQLPRDELTAYRLIDHRGTVFHQTKAPMEASTAVAVPVGPVLPGWNVVALTPPNASALGGLFAWPARLMVILMMGAILLTGWLLLRQADRQLRNAMQKTNFVASVSHELKTPLTSISMYAEMLQNERVANEDKRREYMGVIVNQTGRLTRLVNNVLTFGRLEQGRGNYDFRPINLAVSLETILATQTPRLKKQGIDLRLTLQPVTVRADRDAVEQVVLNLVDNAVKYGCGDDGGEAIDVRVNAAGEWAEIWVMDQGPGVPARWRKAIFKNFMRVDNSLTRQQGGSGIGLSIARLLVRDMGGTLSYQPQPGYGACFLVRLPKLESDE